MSEKYQGYKFCFVDVETTGVDRVKHNIYQLSAIITRPDFHRIDSINLKFRPFSLEHYAPEALEKGHVTLESLSHLEMTAGEAYNRFTEFLGQHCSKFDKTDKMHFAGYNAPFDSDFVREFFAKHGDNYFGSFFWNPPICIMQGAAWYAQRVRGAFKNFQLGTVCQAAEISWDDSKAHDALYDIAKTIELAKYLDDQIPKL